MALTTETLLGIVRELADRVPYTCEGSVGHLRSDFYWQAMQDFRDLRSGVEMDFTEDDLRTDITAAIGRWQSGNQKV